MKKLIILTLSILTFNASASDIQTMKCVTEKENVFQFTSDSGLITIQRLTPKGKIKELLVRRSKPGSVLVGNDNELFVINTIDQGDGLTEVTVTGMTRYGELGTKADSLLCYVKTNRNILGE